MEHNFFILLELPFDPPEEDTEKIETAIRKKVSLWNQEILYKTSKSVEASEYLAMRKDIEKVMLNSELRGKAAEDARAIKKLKRVKLEKELRPYRALSDTLEKEDLRQLLAGYGAFGFTEAEIKQLFEEGRKQKPQQINMDEILSWDVAKDVKKYLGMLRIPGETTIDNGSLITLAPTLYDFLELPDSSPANKLYERASEKEKVSLLKGGEKNAGDRAMQELYGLCKRIFKIPAQKDKYDRYFELTKYEGINDATDLLALRNQQVLTPRMKESLIEIAAQDYKLSGSVASAYINNYCIYKGYILPGDKVICSHCGAENPAGSDICGACKEPLFVICPLCGRRSDASAVVCKCGFEMENIRRVEELCLQAKRALEILNLQAAENHLNEADRLWPKNKQVTELKNSLSSRKQQFGRELADLKDACKTRHYMKAKDLYEVIRGSFNGYSNSELWAEITTAIDNAQERCNWAFGLSGSDEVLDLCDKAAELCADLPDIQRLRRKYPPDPLTGFSV